MRVGFHRCRSCETCPCFFGLALAPWTLGDESCKKYKIFPIFRKKERGMLHFVQQFGDDRLQIEENHPKFCTFYNIDSANTMHSPVLLYKLQHSLFTLIQIKSKRSEMGRELMPIFQLTIGAGRG